MSHFLITEMNPYKYSTGIPLSLLEPGYAELQREEREEMKRPMSLMRATFI